MLPVLNVLLDCVVLFHYLAQLELFVAFSKVNNKICHVRSTTIIQVQNMN
jgi:hypothetical protein